MEKITVKDHTSTFLLPTNPLAFYLAHKGEFDAAIAKVLSGGWYILGEETGAFEQEFAHYLGVRSAIGVASGTDALHLALRASGIGPGDAVATVSHTAVATVAAIELAGAAPVLIDIDPVTFTMDPNRLEDTIKKHHSGQSPSANSRLKAIIPVHLYGQPADMPAIMEIARRYDMYVIEDCAQSHGASIRGRKTGGWGNLAAFSFYPTKNLGAFGDGGAVVTNDEGLAERLRLLREFGWRERYISDLAGMNTRLDELQAAILRVKLKYLDRENARRQELARVYDALLSPTALILPQVRPDRDHVYHQYVVRSERRNDLRTFLKENSVGSLIHYPSPVHLQPAYQGRIAIGGGGLKQTEQICREVLSLPMYPQMIDEHAQRVSELIVNWDGQARSEG
jgi:dTDP-4-amino-4,6-dideoxygalactose transaminase